MSLLIFPYFSFFLLFSMCVHVLNAVWLLAIPWQGQAPLSVAISRQEYWSGLPFLSRDLPKCKRLLISQLQSPPTVILEPKKINSVTVSIVSPYICHGTGCHDLSFFGFCFFPRHGLCILHMVNDTLSIHLTLSFPLPVSIGLFFMSIRTRQNLVEWIIAFLLLSFKLVFFTLLLHLHHKAL